MKNGYTKPLLILAWAFAIALVVWKAPHDLTGALGTSALIFVLTAGYWFEK